MKLENACHSSPSLWGIIDKLHGGVSLEECRLLSRLASEVLEGCIVEIGSYRGKSAIALASGVRKISTISKPMIYCIDPHEEFIGYYGGKFGSQDRGSFYRTMLITRAFRDVALINMSSHDVAQAWRRPIGLLFIDGDHRYESVKRDFQYWEPHVLLGGLIVFHDATDPKCGPFRLIREIMESGRFQHVDTVGRICVLRKIYHDPCSASVPLLGPRRILVVVAGFTLNGGLLRFERVGRVLRKWGHEIVFVDLTGDVKQKREWSPSFPVVSLDQALQQQWDSVMVPGAGFPEWAIRTLRVFQKRNFGIRVQHILNDQSRFDRFKIVNRYFKPDIVIFNNDHWPPGSFTDFTGSRFYTLIGAVDTNSFRPSTYRSHPLKPGSWIIGGLASKNPEPLVESLRYLPLNMVLKLYGKDVHGLEKRYEIFIRQGRLQLLGEIFDEDLCRFYHNVDCVVMTEMHAGWSNLVAEAMASGTPVVCTPLGTGPIAYHERTALILKEPNPREIAKNVLRLQREPELCRQLAESARQVICSYSWEEYARQLLRLIHYDGRHHYTYAPSFGLYGKWPLEHRIAGLESLLDQAHGSTIIDIGAAEGLIAREFLKRGAKIIHGFDLDPGMVMTAKAICARWNNAIFRHADISNWDDFYNSNADILLKHYDIVIYLGVHHHLPPESRKNVLLKLLNMSKKYFAIRTTQKLYMEDSLEDMILAAGFREINNESSRGRRSEMGLLKIFERQNVREQRHSLIRHFVSYPKSGRTWIRYILYQLGVDKEIVFHHDGFEFNDPACPPHNFSIEDRIRRYGDVDRLVYLERDPRDVMVSLYAQVTGRFKDFFNYKGSISDFIRDPYFGAHNLQKFRVMWDYLIRRFGFLKITYEECHRNMELVIEKLLKYYGFSVSKESIRRAVENARFDKMKQLEQSRTFPYPWLRPRNDAPKVRKGKIGSFVEELNNEDIEYLNKIFSCCAKNSVK
ncbi:class I SAM-dependent methyltransferase [Thermodesulforhabdus norvegica]|uniref:Methyltransferase domain-containing protein n=1 Tax=Thermodesulforhabdus norvegica TaxID=39841 RepID=A0A1I4TDV3_9BACT|nr:class I SAM-dependent methyltransferase [Thermodesulforhabdus norvegica]SFM74862.1 Methyltransferase domain-containing protein [Thermodesulforhabdus norvegica]